VTGNEWKRTQQVVLKRDGHQCVECRATKDLHVHHLIPRHSGGKDDPANLVTLCSGCHASRHPSRQLLLARRFIEGLAIRIARWVDRTNQLPAETDRVFAALRLLRKDRLRDGQLEVILSALRGDSVLVVRPTGWGKSLCFQIPALLRDAMSYVISPTKPLMADQVSGLQKIIPVTFINSDLSHDEREERLRLIEQQMVKLAYVAPERFDRTKIADGDEVNRLSGRRPAFLVVDEAHLVYRWGDSFRPSYGRLGEVREQLGSPPVLAFTATAGRETQKRITESLGIPDAKVFVSDVDRPNIGLIRYNPRSESERVKLATGLIDLARRRDGKTMIFVPTIKIGEQVQRDLQTQAGLDLPFVHGQLSDKLQRQNLEGRWAGRIEPELKEVIATSAMGMGIDVPNVRAVIHWSQPESVEDYLQEIGRAGRDGRPAVALVFKQERDTALLEYRAKMTVGAAGGGPCTDDVLKRKYRDIDTLHRLVSDRKICFRRKLLEYCNPEALQKRSWSLRLLEWCLGARRRVKKAGFCCDCCDKRTVAMLLDRCRRAGESATQKVLRHALPEARA